MSEHENIRVRCMTCTLTFTTSRDSFNSQEASCPACDEKKLAEQSSV